MAHERNTCGVSAGGNNRVGWLRQRRDDIAPNVYLNRHLKPSPGFYANNGPGFHTFETGG